MNNYLLTLYHNKIAYLIFFIFIGCQKVKKKPTKANNFDIFIKAHFNVIDSITFQLDEIGNPLQIDSSLGLHKMRTRLTYSMLKDEEPSIVYIDFLYDFLSDSYYLLDEGGDFHNITLQYEVEEFIEEKQNIFPTIEHYKRGVIFEKSIEELISNRYKTNLLSKNEFNELMAFFFIKDEFCETNTCFFIKKEQEINHYYIRYLQKLNAYPIEKQKYLAKKHFMQQQLNYLILRFREKRKATYEMVYFTLIDRGNRLFVIELFAYKGNLNHWKYQFDYYELY